MVEKGKIFLQNLMNLLNSVIGTIFHSAVIFLELKSHVKFQNPNPRPTPSGRKVKTREERKENNAKKKHL